MSVCRFALILLFTGLISLNAFALEIPEHLESDDAVTILQLDKLELEEQKRVSLEVIKKAKKLLSSKYHPDKVQNNGGSPADIEKATELQQNILRAFNVINEKIENSPTKTINISEERAKSSSFEGFGSTGSQYDFWDDVRSRQNEPSQSYYSSSTDIMIDPGDNSMVGTWLDGKIPDDVRVVYFSFGNEGLNIKYEELWILKFDRSTFPTMFLRKMRVPRKEYYQNHPDAIPSPAVVKDIPLFFKRRHMYGEGIMELPDGTMFMALPTMSFNLRRIEGMDPAVRSAYFNFNAVIVHLNRDGYSRDTDGAMILEREPRGDWLQLSGRSDDQAALSGNRQAQFGSESEASSSLDESLPSGSSGTSQESLYRDQGTTIEGGSRSDAQPGEVKKSKKEPTTEELVERNREKLDELPEYLRDYVLDTFGYKDKYYKETPPPNSCQKLLR